MTIDVYFSIGPTYLLLLYIHTYYSLNTMTLYEIIVTSPYVYILGLYIFNTKNIRPIYNRPIDNKLICEHTKNPLYFIIGVRTIKAVNTQLIHKANPSLIGHHDLL